METRTLRIWDGEAADASDNCGPASEYKGFYIDDDKNNAEDMGTITWPVRRVGFIFDTKKTCIVCFTQYVTSFDDPCPTDIVVGQCVAGAYKVLAAWSTDPLKADPPRQQVPCQVSAFGKRDMTEKEKLVFANIPREPLALAGRQRYSDEQETKNREAKFDALLPRLTEKFSVSLASAIKQAFSVKPEDAPVKANEAPSDMLTIRQSAEYARVDVRTIRNWLETETGDGSMLKGSFHKGRLTRIPRCALDPYRKTEKAARKKRRTPPKRPPRKAVKRKS
jgi:hypothetical protein